MKAYIDRIEDGKTAVVLVEKMGQLFVPVKLFPFPVHDGMHLILELKPDQKSETKTEQAIKDLKDKLLKRPKNS
jgi:hypothetical protein